MLDPMPQALRRALERLTGSVACAPSMRVSYLWNLYFSLMNHILCEKKGFIF